MDHVHGGRAYNTFNLEPYPLSPQKKLYVANMPVEKSESEIKALFGSCGEVVAIDYHTKDPTKLYVVRICHTLNLYGALRLRVPEWPCQHGALTSL